MEKRKKKNVPAQSLANLIPAKKGEVRNPHGRPRGRMLSTILKDKLNGKEFIIMKDVELLDKKYKPTGEKVNVQIQIPNKEQIVYALLHEAKQGNIRAMENIWDRMEGKAPQFIEGDFSISKKGSSIDWSKVPTEVIIELKKYIIHEEETDEDD